MWGDKMLTWWDEGEWHAHCDLLLEGCWPQAAETTDKEGLLLSHVRRPSPATDIIILCGLSRLILIEGLKPSDLTDRKPRCRGERLSNLPKITADNRARIQSRICLTQSPRSQPPGQILLVGGHTQPSSAPLGSSLGSCYVPRLLQALSK